MTTTAISSHIIDAFIARLAETEPPPHVVNPYAAGGNPYSAARRQNLRLYLAQMAALQPRLLLVLEAPSYCGMRLTGVPAAGHLLINGVPGLELFGAARGYQSVDEPGFPQRKANQTASAVWGMLAELGQHALVWNAFPFHPHQPENPYSNRTPKPRELSLGEPFLREIMAMYPCSQVIAVGNIASRLLTIMQIEHRKIRHPAQGGKHKFAAGLRAALHETSGS
jgi:uracil-DNA glycosylase